MTNHKPLVSVIIIFLNPGAFLQEAIDSVLAQSYDRRELLLVDDGSTDGSTDVALQHAARYPGLRFFAALNPASRVRFPAPLQKDFRVFYSCCA